MKFIFSIFIVLSLFFFGVNQVQAATGTDCTQSSQCTVGDTTYPCKTKTSSDGTVTGKCGGPCTKTTEEAAATKCQALVGVPLGWVASTCTAANDASGKPGTCAELPSNQLSSGPQSGTALLTIVDVTTNWVFAIFVVLAIIFVILAAFQFVTAGGDAAKIGEARQKLIWASVGVIVALVAKGIVPVVKAIVGG